MTGRVPIPISD